jgi:hypothetical protein
MVGAEGFEDKPYVVRHVSEFSRYFRRNSLRLSYFPEVSGSPVVYGFSPLEPISTKIGSHGIPIFWVRATCAMQCLERTRVEPMDFPSSC